MVIFFNALWIVGCAILLAQFSIRRWEKEAQVTETSPRNRFIVTNIAYLLILVGVVAVNDAWWQRLLWLLTIGLLIGSNYLEFKSVKEPIDDGSQDVNGD